MKMLWLLSLEKEGLSFEKQAAIEVLYDEKVVGNYIADFIVDGKIIVEVKAVVQLCGKEENQLLNYLTATDKEVGLLLNFGEKAQIKRKVYDNELKVWMKRE